MCYDQEKTQDVSLPGSEREREYREMRAAKQRLGLEEVYAEDAANCAVGQLGRALSEKEILTELFSYHPPTPITLPKFAAINQAAKNFAEVVLQNCPGSADRSAAIRLIRDARMTANAAVALNGVSL